MQSILLGYPLISIQILIYPVPASFPEAKPVVTDDGGGNVLSQLRYQLHLLLHSQAALGHLCPHLAKGQKT